MQHTTTGSVLLHRVLSIPAFRLLWIAQVVSQGSFNMLAFVLALHMYERTGSNTAVSLVYLTMGLPAALFGLVSGVYVDRFNKKLILLSTTLIRAALLVVLIVFRSNLLLVYIVTALVSLLSQFFVPAEAALIPKFVPAPLLLSANSLFTLTFYSAIIGGFVAGGPLVGFLGITGVLILLVGLFLVSALCVYLLPNAKAEPKNQRQMDVFTDVKACFAYIQKTPRIYQAIILICLAQAVVGIVATLGPGFSDTVLGVALTDASLILLGPAAVGMVIGALIIGSFGLRFKRRSLIQGGFYLSGFLLILVAIIIIGTQSPAFSQLFSKIFFLRLKEGILFLAIGAFFLLGVGNSMIDVCCNALIQERTADSMRGKVFGLLGSLVSGASVLPVVISGLVADFFGMGTIMCILGLFLISIGVIIHFSARIRFSRIPVSS